MNRTTIMLVEVFEGTTSRHLRETNCVLLEAESNSPNYSPRLAGRGDNDSPQVREFVQKLLEMLPPTYGKDEATLMCKEAVAEVFL